MVNLQRDWNRLRTMTFLPALTLCLMLAGAATAADGPETTPEGDYSKGVKRCMTCHKEGKDLDAHEIFMTPMGISGDPKSPFSEGKHDCETCHGPSKAHLKRQKDGTRLPPPNTFTAKTPVETQNKVCLGCHTTNARFHWPGSTHEIEDLACVNCHQRHAPRDRVFDSFTQQQVCFGCHPRVRAETLRQSSHPLRFGKMKCTDCHNMHAGQNDFLLQRSTVNDTCYTCHAEKRGPFLWEHAPVTEDCTLCHNPHGSNHASLLKQRPPLLCQQCHAPSGHPSTAYTSESAQNSFQATFLLGRACTNCHSQVHGSNHPSGVKINR